MAYDFRELKARVKPEFHKNYGKYYPVDSLESIGFSRRVCGNCGRGFWSAVDRNYCDEPACSGGYRFIGENLARKPFKYKEAWDTYVKVFSKWDYVPIKRYPVVCRWYDELYFVNAGINDFQPYVVAGEVPPPADAVLEPQFCLRFSDIDSVGITGRHYTGFIMVGQHTFNTPEKHVYFKDDGILQMHEFLTKGLGIAADEIFYHEDVWAGGGNFGPSMEFFVRGLELGNQVYMQYEVLPGGKQQELKTKVIDMGAGLERWSWFSQGTPMSYDTVFPKAMEFLYEETGVKPDKELWSGFARYAGLLSFDEIDDAGRVWNEVAGEVGVDVSELKEEVFKMRALYSIADHTRTLLVAVHDGALPSNVGGGYNLRNILRRCWGFMDEYGFEFELEKVFEKHIKEFGRWYTELKEVGSLWDILSVERGRFVDGRKKAKAVVSRMVAEGGGFSQKKLVELYDSQGIHPNVIREFKKDLVIPDNFYQLVEERHEKSKVFEDRKDTVLSKNYPETKTLYYEDMNETCFTATVVGTEGDHVVLDQTLFYPEGGGQEADLGTLDGVEVVGVTKEGKIVAHKVENPKKFKKGAKIRGCVDADRRRQLMQHHTATHIINAAANKILGPHIWQAGAHKSVSNARLDVTHYKSVSADERAHIEEEANRIVTKGVKVKKIVLPREEAEKRYGFRIYRGGAVPGTELRIVDIAGVDAEACGGTHLDNTKDIEDIIIVGTSRIQDGIVRIEFKAGNAAKIERFKRSFEAYNLVHSIGPLLQWQKQMEDSLKPVLKARKQMEDSLKPVLQWQKQMEDSLKPVIEEQKKLQRQMASLSSIFSVTEDKLSETTKRFVDDVISMEKELTKMESITYPKLVMAKIQDKPLTQVGNHLFERWKADKKILEKHQTKKGSKLEEEIETKFSKSSLVKKITKNLDVKTLMKVTTNAVRVQGRTLILLNIIGPKCNVVVASSNPKVDAGKVASKLSKELGGGGRGDKKLGVGGGNSKNAEKILEKLKIL